MASPPPAAPAASPPGATPVAGDPYPGVNSLAHDRGIWHELLGANSSIRRTVRHSAKGVEAVTESDDPVVAAKIVAHAKAMQARMKTGARVRMWDPVFAELFARHGAVTLEVAPTEKGVRITESSDDPEALALLRSHAMGVSEFVRAGFDAAPLETHRFKVGDPLPAPELAIGGVPHHFLLAQPDAGQLGLLKGAGVDLVINFRKPAEHADYDEQGAAAHSGLSYCNLPYGGIAELTDEVIDAARAAIRSADEKGDAAALHCRTGNRVGPGWAAYRALDRGVAVEQALGEAKAMQMLDPLAESRTRDYIRRHDATREVGAGWVPVAPTALSPTQQAQRERAVEAKDAMFARLLAALSDTLSKPSPEGGAAAAIGLCKELAPKIAQAIAHEKHLMIGRTSEKLRNPANCAPAWVGAILADATSAAEPRLAAGSDGSLGVVLPIKLASNCLTCHGMPQFIDPSVRTALAESYPKDQATGYKEGDLRGWFWVEVPPTTGQ